MRELERDLPATPKTGPTQPAAPSHLVIVGRGRAGGSLAKAAANAGMGFALVGRDEEVAVADPGATAVLLCVPDDAIRSACERVAAMVPPGTAIGHVSGATRLSALAAATAARCPAFSIHPLQTIPSPDADLAGAPCAVAASDGEALATARALAGALGMRPFELPEEARAAYHAAAAMASNFLIALEESAAGLLEAAGVADSRDALAPLVLRSAANWADAGAAALTGPIARGDEATVERHRAALAEWAPELVPMYEALAERTRRIAEERERR
jgi:predicted short-subunit dehydrogenase-like oxidoreductase (DUF2520 family)